MMDPSLSNAEREELEQLRKLVGDRLAGGESWYRLDRAEAIRQADFFHGETQKWLRLFEQVKAEREEARATIETMNAERMAWGLQLAEIVDTINRK